MTTLASFYSDVSAEIKRGTSLDARIPSWAKRACEWLEQDYDYDYMKTIERFDYIDGDDVELPERYKRIIYVHEVTTSAVDSSETMRKLTPATSLEISGTQELITHWWIDGDLVLFDGVATETIELEWAFYQYTDPAVWSGVTTAEPAILTYVYNAMLYRTLVNYAASQRDEELRQSYSAELQAALSTAQRADYAKTEGSVSRSMGYVPVR